MKTYRIEMRTGQDMRVVEADEWKQGDCWLVFYRRPPQAGAIEYWRVKLVDVVSMETQP